MTAIGPTTTNPAATTSTDPSSTSGSTNQINENTFLQLLVAQMKYQDPLAPTDSTQFLTQTAQFTEVSTLQQIESDQKAIQSTNQLLAASGMVGRSVSYSTTGIAPATPVATTTVSVGGNLPSSEPVGGKIDVTTTAYNDIGSKVPLQLEFTRTATGWSMQASSGGKNIGAPSAITFDSTGQRTSADVTLQQSDLDQLGGTQGTWPATGVTITMGAPTDPTRLANGPGASNVSVLEQNGGDGQSLTGVVTGVKVTADGPQLEIDGRDVPMTAVTEVQALDS